MRKYGREDVDYETWYSPWAKQLAHIYTREQLEKRNSRASHDAEIAARAHLRAIEASHSMTGGATRRAHAGNVMSARGEEQIAIAGALEIYDLFPEHTVSAKR